MTREAPDPDKVVDAVTFAQYVSELREVIADERVNGSPYGSYNVELDMFLDGMSAWSLAAHHQPSVAEYIEGSNPWQAAAKLLAIGYTHE